MNTSHLAQTLNETKFNLVQEKIKEDRRQESNRERERERMSEPEAATSECTVYTPGFYLIFK